MNIDHPALPKVALIAGPTASGKSALAIALAEREGGCVINADSAQVYADLRVLTARPTTTEMARVPHRLFGHVDGADSYSVARWATEACGVITDCIETGRLPVLVGGTGLYLRALLDGIAPVPEIDPAIRETVRAMPVAEAHRRLQVADPVAAGRLAPTDTTRVARALEVVQSTDRTLADWQGDRVGGIAATIALSPVVLLPDRDWLIERCDRRLAAMFDDGALAEVQALLARTDIVATNPVRRAIGVAEIKGWLDGQWTRDDALVRAQLATRQYAKRQFTWFRNQSPAHWLRAKTTDGEERLALFTEADIKGGR